MDKQILQYLDKVGEKIGGVAKEGFDVYIHGVFVESLIMSIIGWLLIIVPISLTVIGHKKIKPNNDVLGFEENTIIALLFTGILFVVLILIGIFMVIFNAVGVFAPDYVAIKNIVESVKQ